MSRSILVVKPAPVRFAARRRLRRLSNAELVGRCLPGHSGQPPVEELECLFFGLDIGCAVFVAAELGEFERELLHGADDAAELVS